MIEIDLFCRIFLILLINWFKIFCDKFFEGLLKMNNVCGFLVFVNNFEIKWIYWNLFVDNVCVFFFNVK